MERSLKKWITKFGIGLSHSVTVNSRCAYEGVLSLGVSKSKVHRFRYPGVDTELFRSLNRHAIRQQLNIPLDAIVIFSPRGLGTYTNSVLLLQAFAVCAKEIDNLYLYFSNGVGREEWPYHAELARHNGLAERVGYFGQVNWKQMPILYNAADIMVSVCAVDSFPNSVLESLACEVPVALGKIPATEHITEEIEEIDLLTIDQGPDRLANDLSQLLTRLPENLAKRKKAGLEYIKTYADSREAEQRIKQIVENAAAECPVYNIEQ
jgi:glycosyltransferase involved in cell wall biosynthesis